MVVGTLLTLWRIKLSMLVLNMSAVFCVELDLKIVTVTTNEDTDKYTRFMRSAVVNDLNIEAHAVNHQPMFEMLQSALKKYKEQKNLVVIITDNHNAIFLTGKTEILEKFKIFDAKVVVSLVDNCKTDRSSENQCSVSLEEGSKYLRSVGIIGYAPDVYELITSNVVIYTNDSQLYFTQKDLMYREKHNIALDHTSVIFQNLNGNLPHVDLMFEKSNTRVINTWYNTTPVVVYGNGPGKLYLNYLGNYVAKSWTPEDGCLTCRENKVVLSNIEYKEWPRILIGIFIYAQTPFLDKFLTQISHLDYPRDKIDIFLHNTVTLHTTDIEHWIRIINDSYTSVTYKEFDMTRQDGRHMGLSHCKTVRCEYYFSVDSPVTLSNVKTLQILVEQNRTILAPMVRKPGLSFSNFWGDINKDGFYKRSPDYLDIVTYNRRGVWNCPYISEVYLMTSNIIDKIGANPYKSYNDDDIHIEFCSTLRKQEIFMYVTNMDYFGHLKEMDAFSDTDKSHKHNDLYQLFKNTMDWENKYIHPEYSTYTNPISTIPQPCPDVFWVPLTSEKFAHDLIEECEYNGGWSGGRHEDHRLPGGYETVPTVDIHMHQIGYENHWLAIIQKYVVPYVNRVYKPYETKGVAYGNFVVKYESSAQYSLRPHHDSSTYTVNMALNKVRVDYEGGGPRFLRYNCSVTDTRVGWALLHPGRLTHQHEGLPVTKGVRYVMISFVDPEG